MSELDKSTKSRLAQLEKFKNDVDNLMISMEVFDRDRIERGESPTHQDELARYRQILQLLGDKVEI